MSYHKTKSISSKAPSYSVTELLKKLPPGTALHAALLLAARVFGNGIRVIEYKVYKEQVASLPPEQITLF